VLTLVDEETTTDDDEDEVMDLVDETTADEELTTPHGVPAPPGKHCEYQLLLNVQVLPAVQQVEPDHPIPPPSSVSTYFSQTASTNSHWPHTADWAKTDLALRATAKATIDSRLTILLD
jgi:hypothetical protein